MHRGEVCREEPRNTRLLPHHVQQHWRLEEHHGSFCLKLHSLYIIYYNSQNSHFVATSALRVLKGHSEPARCHECREECRDQCPFLCGLADLEAAV